MILADLMNKVITEWTILYLGICGSFSLFDFFFDQKRYRSLMVHLKQNPEYIVSVNLDGTFLSNELSHGIIGFKNPFSSARKS